jgi:peptide/nickel transport system substrate-binding protein
MRHVFARATLLTLALVLFLAGCAPAAPANPTAAPKPTEAAKPAAAAPTAAPAKPAEAAKPAAAAKPTEAAKPAEAAKPSVSGKTAVTVGVGASITTLDPHLETTSQLSTMISHMMETLTFQDPNLTLTGALAESWKAVDSQTWEFKLRPNVKFQDGSEFNATVAKYNIDWVMDPANKANSQRAYVSDIVETTAVDPLTIRVKTKAPSGTLPSRIQRLGMNSQKAMQEMGPEKFGLSPVGTGPYKFVELVRDSHLTLEAFDGYWGKKPTIQKVTFRFIPEDATRVAALQSGTIDLAMNVPPDIAATLDADKNYRVERIHTLRNQYLNINTRTPPFDNVKVRQAMNYAVDKEAIVKNILLGNATVTPAICSPELVFGCPKGIKGYPYDPAKAKELLAEAGFPNGFESTMLNSQGRYLASVDIGQAIAGYMDKVGIKLQVEVKEWGLFNSMFLGGQQPTTFYHGYGNTFADVDGIFSGHFDPARRALYWNDPGVTAKIAAEAAELDPAKRAQLAEGIVQDIFDQAPWVFLWDIHDVHVVKADLNWRARPDEQILMYEASWK